MRKLKKFTVYTIIIVVLSVTFLTTLGTTVYFSQPGSTNGVEEDNRDFKDGYSDFKGYVFKGSEFRKNMYFRVLLPDNYDENTAYPVLMFIHGQGSQGSDNKNQMYSTFLDPYLAVKSEFPAIVFVPQFPKGYHGNGNSKHGHAAIYLLMSCLEAGVLNRYNADRTRIYVTGVSMGGFTSVYLAEQFPDMFAAIMPLCGGTDADPAQVAQKIKDIPTWFAHSKDDNVVPFSFTNNLYLEMVQLGGNPKFTVYEDKGHSISTAFYLQEGIPQGESIWQWLFSQNKD